MEVTVCLKISCLRLPDTIFSKAVTYTPGVSIILTSPSMISNYLRSRVIPAWLSTMANDYPIKQLNSVDLPEFGNPINETRYFTSCGSLKLCHLFSFFSFLLCILSTYTSLCKISCFFLLTKLKLNTSLLARIGHIFDFCEMTRMRVLNLPIFSIIIFNDQLK